MCGDGKDRDKEGVGGLISLGGNKMQVDAVIPGTWMVSDLHLQ